MAKFITGTELEDAIRGIIWDAKQTLLIVSPFIKLDDYFKKHFEHQLPNSQLHILIVFGKNEQDKSKSLNSEDFEFFKKFPYVSIVYVSNLHAKYYGNESKGVITSVNMYDHSFKNNIEFGVFNEDKLIDKLTKSADNDAWEKCMQIADAGEPVFIKRPVVKKNMLSSLLGKNYLSSTVLLDNTETFFNLHYKKQHDGRKLPAFGAEIDFANQPDVMPSSREEMPQQSKSTYIPVKRPIANNSQVDSRNDNGYCIRTGVSIPYNPDRPFSLDAYRNWAQYENLDYSENYCHKSGRKSYGKTSMRNPILN